MDEALAKYVLGLPVNVRRALCDVGDGGIPGWYIGDNSYPALFEGAANEDGDRYDALGDDGDGAFVPVSEAAIMEHARVIAGADEWLLIGRPDEHVASLHIDGWFGSGRARGDRGVRVRGVTALEAAIRLLAAVVAAREVGHG